MRLRILSDLHLEFHRDNGASFIKDQKDKDYDVLILAGDITTEKHLGEVLSLWRKSVGDRNIVYVPGNHEYYDSSISKVQNTFDAWSKQDNKLHVLDNSQVTIDGVKFVGSTLWFAHSGKPERGDEDLNDFHLIGGFRNWISQQAKDSAQYLKDNVKEGDIVITHHLPHPKSIHPRFAGSYLNKYFLHDVSDVVENSAAKLWVYGHTHSSFDFTVSKTRLVCNPFGYLRYEQNSEFKEKLTIEI